MYKQKPEGDWSYTDIEVEKAPVSVLNNHSA